MSFILLAFASSNESHQQVKSAQWVSHRFDTIPNLNFKNTFFFVLCVFRRTEERHFVCSFSLSIHQSMFDGLGQNKDRPRHHRRATSVDAAAVAPKRLHDGKGQVCGLSKNMPSLLGVLGVVDRLYRPALANQLFGPPSSPISEVAAEEGRKHAQHRSAEALNDKVETKAYQHAPPHATNFALQVLQTRAAALEHKIHDCDATIRRHEEEALTVMGLRDMHIAKKKNRLRRIHNELSLETQPQAALKPFSHALAEAAANRNGITASKPAPAFISGVGIPGTEGYMVRPQAQRGNGLEQSAVLAAARGRSTTAAVSVSALPPTDELPKAASTATASASAGAATLTGDSGTHEQQPLHLRQSPHWKSATEKRATDLINDFCIPREACASQLRPQRGPRVFPERHSTTAPYAVQASLRMPQKCMEHSRLSTPVQWFQREVDRSVSSFNRGCVFTPHARREPPSCLVRSVVPEPAAGILHATSPPPEPS